MLAGVRNGNTSTSATSLPFPLCRWGEPAEIGNVIVFLLGGKASYITGSVYSVDGGWCV